MRPSTRHQRRTTERFSEPGLLGPYQGELQRDLDNAENGTSLARSTYAFNSANVEGWGLYSETIMMEYLPLEGQLFTLFARLQRAARMFMDPMVNLGLLKPEDAVDFMVNQIGLSKAMASSEADRYAFGAPGQATSYYYGYRNLERLRTEVEMALGDRFNQQKYHDFLL